SQRLAVSLRSSIAKRRSHLNAALVCKRKNVAISQDLAVKAHVVSAFNFSVNQRGKKPKLASFQRLICSLVL
ncbi:hypothetical protein P7M41_25045, partial [Vibrio parahaemolyticus]|nr:hypothetical protein [Vibrio parahaemolyticus]MDF4326700.1 hypothetical protein [Vibrio parahaemolyticus]MDG2555288.1 hypothetical protein [Vibrio parahaemolyticus]